MEPTPTPHAGTHRDPGTNAYCYTHAHSDAVAFPRHANSRAHGNPHSDAVSNPGADPCADRAPRTYAHANANAHESRRDRATRLYAP